MVGPLYLCFASFGFFLLLPGFGARTFRFALPSSFSFRSAFLLWLLVVLAVVAPLGLSVGVPVSSRSLLFA